MLVDTHCHLGKDDYENINKIIENMQGNIMIASGIDPKTNLEVLELVEKHPNVYGMIGFHPSEAEIIQSKDFELLEQQLKHSKIVGIGEIGLDYHYSDIDKSLQQNIFIRQIQLANQIHKPIIIHSRDAYLDTYNIIKEYKDKNIKMVMHCYGYSLESAKELIKFNTMFGIGGVLTFKNSKKLKEVVEYLPLSHILLETDSPYLTPEPYRGQKNEPANVKYVAEKVAEIKKMNVTEVCAITTHNAFCQFDLEDEVC